MSRSDASPTKPAGPGRPKDPAKRAAILEAAKRMFTQHGFDGASMDQIATEAGVSKLTVYSHFGDKEGLFGAAVKSHCEQSLPTTLFHARPDMPLRERLLEIAEAFYAMISSPEAVAGHRMLCSPQLAESPLPRLFWEAGPMRVQRDFAGLLQRRIEAGELVVPDVPRAAAQFFTLLKGEPHAQLVFGCCRPGTDDVHVHLAASVDMFLSAYAARRVPRAP
ncbi:TetR/AcrR family transcriptional regulator [Marilutibacter aestuarii]|uniref:TetR/AcrR family transcriptional regulator n=1 Tax=Marilutibacter aestuarii TaxID=1706195 RepID=A0A508APP8_9GAMM|nr:TetR/AcrR family transcriptional regulator [Lysobacter aestuarii]TQD51719.1 TetR/AcrR family transcriptional regulator [Lysobacter aestuarii]